VPAIAKSFVLTLLAALFCVPFGSAHPEERPPLVLERTIPLAGVSGRIDHLAIDLRRKRLLVAELGNNTVDAIDLVAGKAIHRIAGLHEPQGIGYAPGADVIAVASAGDGSVRLFRGEDFSPMGVINLGADADNVRLDARTGSLVVGYGEGGVAVVDPARGAVASRVKLPAHPEGFQLDERTRRVFVNVPDARQIAVVDLGTGAQISTWRVPGLGANFPMALDDTDNLLATVFRHPARLVLLDARSGTVRANLETCGDADDVFFDQKRSRIYVSCGQGVVDVLQREASDYRGLGRVETASGARTSLFVPELDRLFVAARAGFFGLGSDAAILVFQPQP
jgi:DNA-binding beta-propeller fold protein YncE